MDMADMNFDIKPTDDYVFKRLFGDDENPEAEPTQPVNGCDSVTANVTQPINGCGNPGNTPMGVTDVQEGIIDVIGKTALVDIAEDTLIDFDMLED